MQKISSQCEGQKHKVENVSLQECVDWCLETAQAVHKQRGGLLNPSICLMSRLREFLGVHLPDDAHLRASGRVFISITDSSNRKNIIVSEYDSKEDLIEVRFCIKTLHFRRMIHI